MTTPGALQVSHASGLHAVGRALNEMHREALRAGGALDGGAVRLAVLNLVAACIDVESADLASQAVGRLGAKHPARAIIVLAQPDGDEQMEADLSLQCSAVDATQVCAEQVRLVVGGKAAYHLASVVTPLLVPDIPTYLWLVGAPPARQAFGQDAVAICERLIFDSGAYDDTADALAVLAAELAQVGDALSVSDVAWERTRVWRRVIAESFDGEEVRGFLRGITAIEVGSSGERGCAQAWLLAGWMASRLGWRPSRGTGERVSVRWNCDGATAASDLVTVVIRARSGDHTATITLEAEGGALRSVIDVDGGIRAERAVPLVEVDAVDLVGSLLESGAEDPVYRGALTAAAALAASPK